MRTVGIAATEKGPYDLAPELHYLSPPSGWSPGWLARTTSGPLTTTAIAPLAPPVEAGPMALPEPSRALDRGPVPEKPKLLVRVRAAIQMRQYSPRTEEAYVHWIQRFIFFHKLRHPALLFLYRLLGKEVGVLGDVVRAKRPRRLPWS